MNRRTLLVLVAVALLPTVLPPALSAAEPPLAWTTFPDEAQQSYDDVPYVFLGNRPVYLTINVKPAKGHCLDLLWGAKNDERGAEIVINGTSQKLQAGGYRGFRWQRVNLPEKLAGDKYTLQFLAAPPKAAFLAAVRLVKANSPLDQRLPAAAVHGIETADELRHPLHDWMDELQTENLDPWKRGEIYGRQANEALRRCRKFVDGWLAHADPTTGLIPRNLSESKYFWNGRDCGADNYSFMVLTCALTDRPMFNGRMLDMLRTETKLTSRVGALPADFDFNKQAYRFDEPDINRLIFDGSEYVKDGLMPITEWLGVTPWSERMLSIVGSLLEYAPFETPAGKIPSDNVEVNGEMMQVLSRLRFMTGEEKCLDMACRIADYYLLGDKHPTRNATKLGLRDHNCELISGLTEVYAACHFARKEKVAQYRQPIHDMLDDILKVGVNEHGLMYDMVNPQTGEILRDRIGDNWGYNYNGFYTVYLLDGVERYRQATRKALANLKPHYWKFAWQGWGSDGIADSVEGAINLFNREGDVPGVAEWIDANTTRMLMIQKPDGVIEGWHGDGNYARTAILWVLMKQQGVTIQPWREDVTLGAVLDDEGLRLILTAEQSWSGKLIFDRPRHREVMHLPLDYPRINQFPEWFTVDPQSEYTLQEAGKTAKSARGEELLSGLPVQLDAKGQKHLCVKLKGQK